MSSGPESRPQSRPQSRPSSAQSRPQSRASSAPRSATRSGNRSRILAILRKKTRSKRAQSEKVLDTIIEDTAHDIVMPVVGRRTWAEFFRSLFTRKSPNSRRRRNISRSRAAPTAMPSAGNAVPVPVAVPRRPGLAQTWKQTRYGRPSRSFSNWFGSKVRRARAAFTVKARPANVPGFAELSKRVAPDPIRSRLMKYGPLPLNAAVQIANMSKKTPSLLHEVTRKELFNRTRSRASRRPTETVTSPRSGLSGGDFRSLFRKAPKPLTIVNPVSIAANEIHNKLKIEERRRENAAKRAARANMKKRGLHKPHIAFAEQNEVRDNGSGGLGEGETRGMTDLKGRWHSNDSPLSKSRK